MWPILFQIGPFTLHTYGLFVGLGFLAGYAWLGYEGRRRGFPPSLADSLFGISMVAGLLGARLLYVMVEWSYFVEHPMEIFKIWSGGLVYYGGLFCVVLVAFFYLRRRHIPAAPVADAAAPGLALGQAIGRIGCFSAGCCYGLPTKLPWGVRFSNPLSLAPLDVSLHPTQLYESLLDFGIFVVLVLRSRPPHLYPPPRRGEEQVRFPLHSEGEGRGEHGVLPHWDGRRGGYPEQGEGGTAALYLCFYGASRFLVEFLRGDDRGSFWAGLSPSQWLSIFGVVIGISWLSVIYARQKT